MRTPSAMTKLQARGLATGNMLRLVCQFDQETFKKIRAAATLENISVAEKVRRLVKAELES